MAAYILEIIYTLVTVALLYYFLKTSHTKSAQILQLARHWILFGFIFNFLSFTWLYTAYPIPWIQSGILQFAGIALLHIILSIVASLGFFVVAYSFHSKIQARLLPLAFASALTLSEIIRSLLISIIYYGNDTTIALHFTSGTLGNALSTTPFIEFAYFGGTFALTFVLGYLVYIFSTKKSAHAYRYHTLSILLILLCVHIVVPTHTIKSGTSIGIVTTDFSSISKEDTSSDLSNRSKKIHTMTMSLASSSPTPTIVVYPEDTRYFSNGPLSYKTDLLVAFPATLFIDGDTLRSKQGSSNMSIFYYPEENSTQRKGKELLLPFNEYIPYFFSFLFTLFIDDTALESYRKNHTYIPVHSNKTISFEGASVGTLICSEILSFSTINSLHKEHPDIVFFQSNLSIFHDNPLFVMHLRSFTKVAAAQLRTTLISSSNGAPSLVVSPFGKEELYIPRGFSTSTYIIP